MPEKDTLSTAMEEIMSVAEELKAIQNQAKKYVDASKRMNGIGDALEKLILVVGRVPEQFTIFISSTNELLELFEASKASLENSSAALPRVIESIESADVFKSLSAFTSSIEKLENSMTQRIDSLEGLSASLTKEQKKNQEALVALNVQTNAIEAKIGTFHNDITSLMDITNKQSEGFENFKAQLIDQLKDNFGNQSKILAELQSLVLNGSNANKKALEDITGYAAKNLLEISAVNTGLEARTVSQQQTLWLQQVSKKKGLFF